MTSSRTVVRLLALITCLVGSCTVVVGSGDAASRGSPSEPCGRNHAPLVVYFAGIQVDAFSLSQAFTECSLGRNDPLVSYNYGPCPNRVLEAGPGRRAGSFQSRSQSEPLQACHLRPNVVVRGVPGTRLSRGTFLARLHRRYGHRNSGHFSRVSQPRARRTPSRACSRGAAARQNDDELSAPSTNTARTPAASKAQTRTSWQSHLTVRRALLLPGTCRAEIRRVDRVVVSAAALSGSRTEPSRPHHRQYHEESSPPPGS